MAGVIHTVQVFLTKPCFLDILGFLALPCPPILPQVSSKSLAFSLPVYSSSGKLPGFIVAWSVVGYSLNSNKNFQNKKKNPLEGS